MRNYVKSFSRWMDATIETSPEQLRDNRLTIVLWTLIGVTAGIIMLVTAYAVFNPGSVPQMDLFGIYAAALIELIGIGMLMLIRRYVSSRLSSILLIGILIAAIIFSDSLNEIVQGRSAIFFIVPIIIASIILQPRASLIVAMIESIILLLFTMALPSNSAPNIPGIFALLITALLTWLATDGLERAVRKLQEMNRSLAESEQKFLQAFHSNAFLMSINDAQNRYLEVNQVFLDATGYRAEEVIGRTPVELGLMVDSELSHRAAQILREQGTLKDFEMPVRYRNGEIRTGMFYAAPIQVNGETLFLAAMNDITKRKQAQQAARENEEKIQAMLRAVPDIMFRLDRDGMFLDYKADRNDLFVLPEATFIGKKLADIFSVEFAEFGHRKIIAALETNELQMFEYQLPMRERGLRDYEARMVPSGEGEVIAIVRDITERKQSERILQERIDEATAELREQNALIQNINDNLVTGMIYQVYRFKDGTRKFTYLSEGARRMYGIDPQDGMNDPNLIYSRVHEADRGRVWQEEEEANQSMSAFKTEVRMINPDGSIRWSSFVSNPIDMGDGVTCWNGVELDITERKQAEQILKSSEEKFWKVFQTSPLSLAIVRLKDFSVVDVNDIFLKISGFSREELIGNTTDKLLGWVYPDQKQEALNALAVNGEIIDQEYAFRLKNGDIRIGSFSAFKIEINKEQFILASIFDITERKRSEEAVKESRELFLKTFEISPMLITISEIATGKYLEVNEAFVKASGYSRSEAIGKTSIELGWITECDRVELVRRLNTDGFVNGMEIDLHAKAGNVVKCLYHGRIISSATRPLLLSTAEDITKRKQTEEALRKSEERFRALIEHSSEAISLIDMRGVTLYDSPSSINVTGYSVEEQMGRYSFELIHPDDINDALAAFGAVAQSPGSTTKIVSRMLHKNGHYIDIECVATNLLHDPAVQAVVVNFRDVSERKRAEEALRQANELLEQRVEERTAELRLSREQLRELAQKLVATQENERSRIAQELHDDLGQLLTSLKLQMELAAHARESAKRGQALSDADSILGELIGKVRNMSLDLRPRILDDYGLFEALRWYFKRFESLNKILIRSEIKTDSQQRLPSSIETTAFRIIQEALTNIVRHASVQEAQVTVSCNVKGVHIEIIDHGAGFTTGQGAASEWETSGLPGMRERVQLVGGQITIDSSPGAGTRIVADIPL